MRGMSKRLVLLAVTGLFSAALLSGCGSDGKNGVDGAPGKDGQGVAVKAAESCAVCHGDGKSASVDTAHGLANYQDVMVSNIVPANVGGNLQVSFNVKVNGANKLTYTRVTTAYRLDSTLTRRAIDTATAQLVHAGNGNYTLTIPGGGAWTDSRYLVRIEEAAATPASTLEGRRAVVLFDFGASPKTDVLGVTTSCNDCHGNIAIHGGGYATPSYGGKTCVVCHDAVADLKVDGTDNSASGYSAVKAPRLPAMIHGIHKSGTMPTGKYQVVRPNGTTGTSAEWGPFEIHYPSYMQNCSVCHQAGAPLTAANSKPVSYDFCMTCHQSWDGFTTTKTGGDFAFHRAYTAASNCAVCHDGSTAPATMGAIHAKANSGQGLTTGRAGFVYNGQDISVVEGDKTKLSITGVTRTGNELAITWTATYNGAAVNPCNATATTTAPAFNYAATTASGAQPAVSAQNFSILRAYFQGDDLVNADNGGTAPGQPLSTNLNFTATGNTTCANNVATTKITMTAAEAKLTGKARVALQGKPQLLHATGRKYLVRALTPVYDFNPATGAKAADRRPVAETAKCLKCHVGSLYQHGGNRVDNVELCVMCHNEASSEKNNRVDYFRITDATKLYDGATGGQTYGFKTMLHKIHATYKFGQKPLVYYRSNGIYGFALNQSVLINWPGTGSKTVAGANAEVPANNTKTHNFVVAHYPRALQDCSACHASNFSRIPDATKAVATTIDAGAAPWTNQLDDTLQGPAAAACTSCHSGSAAAAHAAQFGFTPAVLEKGRQTVIDAAK